MVNDATGAAVNCTMKVIIFKNNPHLCLFAVKDINYNEELRYDYGVEDLPWRKKRLKNKQASNILLKVCAYSVFKVTEL